MSVENYSKGKNVEQALTRDTLGIPGLPENFVWMQVKGGSKMRNLLELALEEYEQGRDILWSGSGPALGKTISCAEVMKKKFSPIYQFNKICYRRFEEHWEPKLEGLDPLVVNRDMPMIHILLSHQPVNKDLPGYQMVGQQYQPPHKHTRSEPNKKYVQRPSSHKKTIIHDPGQMESYGLKFKS
uniref:Ribonuclease p protein subunit p25-like protein n=1 Tax=Triatoma infestans TaxID=30076 RepID=A0A170YPL1_TRIIF